MLLSVTPFGAAVSSYPILGGRQVLLLDSPFGGGSLGRFAKSEGRGASRKVMFRTLRRKVKFGTVRKKMQLGSIRKKKSAV